MMEEEKKQGQLQAMWFAAGTAAFMACLERAILVSFIEQWRVVVFLALNLLLLAILFTSASPPTTPSNEPTATNQECNENVEFKVEGRKRSMQKCRSRASMVSAAEDHHDDADGSSDRSKLLQCRSKRENQEIVENVKSTARNQAHELSREEFNQRVEAFIAMFRQHLVSDAKGKSCRLHSSSIKHRAVYKSPSGGIGNRF